MTNLPKTIRELKEHITELEGENEALSEALDFERDYSKSKIAELEKEVERLSNIELDMLEANAERLLKEQGKC